MAGKRKGRHQYSKKRRERERKKERKKHSTGRFLPPSCARMKIQRAKSNL